MHVEIYKIHGRRYRYQVTNYREGTKIKHKKKYLGPVVPINKIQRKKSSGRKPSSFVRKFNEEEEQKLKNTVKSNNAFAKERARIILYSSEGVRVSEICRKIQKEKRSVLSAIKRFNEIGLVCLQRGKTTGRKPKFNEEQKAEMVAAVNNDPRKLNKNFTAWSLSKLRQHLIENKVIEHISIETLRQILKKGNKKYKKSRKWLYSNDPDFAKKNF
jgi:transposase